jgi:hypothetical protein
VSAALVTNIVIGAAVVGLIIVRQIRTRPVREDSAARLMLILGVIGVIDMVNTAKGHSIPARVIGLLAVGLVLALVFGALRALSVQIWRDPAGVAWRRGTSLTIVLWVFSLAAHFGIDFLAGSSSTAKSLASASILLYLAITLGVQRELIRWRAARVLASIS